MHRTDREWTAEDDGAMYRYTLEEGVACPNSRFNVISRRPAVDEEQAVRNNREVCRILLRTFTHKKGTEG